jgi:Mg2+ and Co2+ transporter CorA
MSTAANGKHAIWVALIALVASVLSPLLLAWQLNVSAIEDRDANWAREDAVAARLLASNERVARGTRITGEKLDVIHDLVNSNLESALRGERDANAATLAMMRELVALKRANGHEPSIETLAAIETLENRIAELDAMLADRRKNAAQP